MNDRREFYFEFVNIGNFTQVRAVDSLTGLEVAVTTPANTARAHQIELAKRKLLMMLEKRNKV